MTSGLLVAACGSSTPRATPTPTAEGTQAPHIIIIPLGQTARLDDAEITIKGVRNSDNEEGESSPTGLEWLFLDVSVRNTGSDPFSLYVHLMHPDGREFDRAHPPTSSQVLDQPIQAGSSVDGEVAFLVDKGTVGAILTYGPNEPRWALELGAIGKQ